MVLVKTAAPFFQQLNAVSATTGACYAITEFGPGLSVGPSPTNMEPLEIVYAADACNIGVIAWAYDDHAASSPPEAEQGSFCLLVNWRTGYATKAVTDLTYYGQKYIADPIKGVLTTAVKTTV